MARSTRFDYVIVNKVATTSSLSHTFSTFLTFFFFFFFVSFTFFFSDPFVLVSSTQPTEFLYSDPVSPLCSPTCCPPSRSLSPFPLLCRVGHSTLILDDGSPYEAGPHNHKHRRHHARRALVIRDECSNADWQCSGAELQRESSSRRRGSN